MHNHAEKEWEGQRQEDRHLCCKQHEQIYRDGPACVVYSTLSMPSFWPQTIQKSFFVFLPSWFYVPWNNSNKYFKALFSEDTSKLFFRNICSGLVSLHPEVCPSLSQSLVQYKCFFCFFFIRTQWKASQWKTLDTLVGALLKSIGIHCQYVEMRQLSESNDLDRTCYSVLPLSHSHKNWNPSFFSPNHKYALQRVTTWHALSLHRNATPTRHMQTCCKAYVQLGL